ncbi:MAG: hypothetical protein IPH09_17385 [bacterium]|nr:hypothetical protein [bacterium]
MRPLLTRNALRWTALPALLFLATTWLGVQATGEPAMADSAACCCGTSAGDAHDCCCSPDGDPCGPETCGSCPGPGGSRTSPFTVETSPPPAPAKGTLILADDVAAPSRSTAPAERPPIAG